MALGDSYATLDQLKDYLKIPLTKTSYDQSLNDALASASYEIDQHCNRQFNLAASASVRYFTPRDERVVKVDDFATTAGFVLEVDLSGTGTSFQTWTSSDYELFPLDGIVDGTTGWPYSKIRAVGGKWFPLYNLSYYRKGIVKVTAQWGWSAVPAPVKQACLIISAETWKLKDAPFGVAGMDQFGATIRVRENRMAAAKLRRFVKDPIQVG